MLLERVSSWVKMLTVVKRWLARPGMMKIRVLALPHRATEHPISAVFLVAKQSNRVSVELLGMLVNKVNVSALFRSIQQSAL